MAAPIFQRTIVDSDGNVEVGASVTVRNEANNELAAIYVDRDLTEVKANPFVTDETGLAQFFVARGEYKVTATSGDSEIEWRFVQMLDTDYIVQADDNNNVGIGGNTSGVVAGVEVASKFCVKNEGDGPVAGFVHANNTTANSGSVTFACRSRGTLEAPTVVQSGDALWHMYVAGNDGTDLALAAHLAVEVDGTPGNNDMPGRLVIKTTPDGSQIPSERLRITSTGAWGLAGENYGTADTQAIVSNGNAAPTWQTVLTPTAEQTLIGKTINGPDNTLTNIANASLSNSSVTIGTTTIALGATGNLVAGDIPNLDASKITSGVIASARLPSYVDDVLEFANLASFPDPGETGKIYIALDTNKVYRWSGSVYVYITSGAVDSVAGKTGIVTLDKNDVGLSNVDNTADSAKNVATAATLTTARTIGGVSFDGSANINLPGVNIAGNQDTSGNAATATNVAYSGLTGTVPTWNQDTTGNAATATALQTARTIGGVSFDGTANINLPGVNTAGNQNTTGTAANVTGTVAVANGGTGATTLTANNLVVGSGTSAVGFIAPGTAGNVLTSNGTIWESVPAAASGGGVTVAASAPAGPSDGDLWYDTTNNTLKIWITSTWRGVGSYT
jgi:hypothetical protein